MVTAAAFQMARSNKKIALMSFCDNERKNNIENFAFTADDMPDIGNPLTELGDFEFNDTGIDALVRRSETGVLAKEHFNTCCMPAVKTPNGLDVIGTTNTENFEDDMAARFDVAKGVLETANEMYNFVFVLADPQHKNLVQKLDEIADKIVVVIRQAKIDRDLDFSKEILPKVSLLVADYETESSFGLRYLKKGYKAKNLYAIPHSVPYRDACANGALVRFALRNTSLAETPGDINYAFSTAINGLLDNLCGKAETEEEIADKQEQEEDELQLEEIQKKKKDKKLKNVSEDDVNPVVISKKKKGLFKKKETFERVEIGGESPLESDEEVIDEGESAIARRNRDEDDIPKKIEDESPIHHISSVDDEGNDLDDESDEEVEESFDDADDIVEDEDEEIEEPEAAPILEPVQTSEEVAEDGNAAVGNEETIDIGPADEDTDEFESSNETDEDVPEDVVIEDDDETTEDIVEDEDVVEAIPEDEEKDEKPKKRGGFFSFLRKKEVNVREADFSKVEHKAADAIEEEIQETLRAYDRADRNEAEDLLDVIDDEEPAAEEAIDEDLAIEEAETATDDVEENADAEVELEAEEMYDEDDEEMTVSAPVIVANEEDEEDDVPVITEAPRKLSRREKRMLREAIHVVK